MSMLVLAVSISCIRLVRVSVRLAHRFLGPDTKQIHVFDADDVMDLGRPAWPA